MPMPERLPGRQTALPHAAPPAARVQRPRLLPSQKVRALPRLSAEDLVFTSTVSAPVFLPLLFQTSFIDIVFTYLKIHPFKVYSSALAGGSVGWLIISYAKRLRGSIPSQGTYLGCSFNPWLKCVQETTDCVSHINVSLSLSLSLSLKSINITSGED